MVTGSGPARAESMVWEYDGAGSGRATQYSANASSGKQYNQRSPGSADEITG